MSTAAAGSRPHSQASTASAGRRSGPPVGRPPVVHLRDGSSICAPLLGLVPTSRPTSVDQRAPVSVHRIATGPACQWNSAPGRRAAEHDAQRLIDAVGCQLLVQRGHLAHQLLGVEAVDQHLMGLPPSNEAPGLVVVEPGPHRVGVVAGSERGQQAVGASSWRPSSPE
jgi:hypothetical protein